MIRVLFEVSIRGCMLLKFVYTCLIIFLKSKCCSALKTYHCRHVCNCFINNIEMLIGQQKRWNMFVLNRLYVLPNVQSSNIALTCFPFFAFASSILPFFEINPLNEEHLTNEIDVYYICFLYLMSLHLSICHSALNIRNNKLF